LSLYARLCSPQCSQLIAKGFRSTDGARVFYMLGMIGAARPAADLVAFLDRKRLPDTAGYVEALRLCRANSGQSPSFFPWGRPPSSVP